MIVPVGAEQASREQQGQTLDGTNERGLLADRAPVIRLVKAKTSKRLLFLQGGLEAKARWYERLLLTSAVKLAEPAVP